MQIPAHAYLPANTHPLYYLIRLALTDQKIVLLGFPGQRISANPIRHFALQL